MNYIYPALFHHNEDESYTVIYPDLPGCVSEGKGRKNALDMAQSALTQWIGYLIDKNCPLPAASSIDTVKVSEGEWVHLIRARTLGLKRKDKSVRDAPPFTR